MKTGGNVQDQKKTVFKFRSVKSMVMAPPNTGKDNNNKRALIATDHTNNGIRSNLKPTGRMLITVVIKLMAPKIEEIPAKWREKNSQIHRSPCMCNGPRQGGGDTPFNLFPPHYLPCFPKVEALMRGEESKTY